MKQIVNKNQVKNQIKSQNENQIRNQNKSQSLGQTNHCQKKNQYLLQNLITMEIWHNRTSGSREGTLYKTTMVQGKRG